MREADSPATFLTPPRTYVESGSLFLLTVGTLASHATLRGHATTAETCAFRLLRHLGCLPYGTTKYLTFRPAHQNQGAYRILSSPLSRSDWRYHFPTHHPARNICCPSRSDDSDRHHRHVLQISPYSVS